MACRLVKEFYEEGVLVMLKKKILALAVAAAFSGIIYTPVYAAELPEVKILATGGTIAGTAASDTQMTGYKAGDLGIQTLINAVPALNDIALVSGEQVANIGSESMTTAIWLKLADRCNILLSDPKVKGLVITHGTDTLEETAYFLNLTVKSDKPVVLVGAMRPATAISADGPVNLLNAVKLASSPQAVGKGVLVAMNDEINGARDVTKTNTSTVSTFKSPELGSLGYFANGEPHFYKESSRKHTKKSEFDVSGLKELPRVDIIYTHVNDDGALIDASVKSGAKGIVYAGSGMGSIHQNAEPALAQAVKSGVTVVRSSRCGNGMVVACSEDYTREGFLNGDTLNPQKARILLQLALTKSNNPKEIQRMFDEY